jgi:hypothetical protein
MTPKRFRPVSRNADFVRPGACRMKLAGWADVRSSSQRADAGTGKAFGRRITAG